MSATNSKKTATIEERNARSLESIANSLDALSLWFEEVDKDEWGSRIQFYLAEFMKVATGKNK